MDASQAKARRRWPNYLATILVLLLVLYPLSVGPVAGWVNQRPRDGTTYYVVETVYWPITLAVRASHTQDYFAAYCNWWMRITKVPPPPDL